MLGAIIGDIVGSVYEFDNIKTKNFSLFREDCRFTDDTVMTIAVRNALREYDKRKDLQLFQVFLVCEMQRLGQKYADRGYGRRFAQWLLMESPKPYGSFGNGAAMRVSPVGEYASSLEEAMKLAKASAEVSHDHPEGIKGAQAVAAAVFLARQEGWGKARIKNFMEGEFYPLDFTLEEIRETYTFDVSCQGSVPQALACFFEGESFEDVIRNCISIGGDCDTTAAIAGGIAEGYYGLPEGIVEEAMKYLSEIAEEISELDANANLLR